MIKRILPTPAFKAAINANSPSDTNPFATIADVIGINIVTVPTYSSLPSPATVTNKYYRTLVGENSSWRPAWLGGTYYPEGIYFSDGSTWDYVGEFPYQADQLEVDAGVNDKNFVTPLTLKNAAQWNTKFDVPTGAITDYLDGTGTPKPMPASSIPGGSDKKVQYNNAGAFGGANNVEINDSELAFPIPTGSVNTPISRIKVYGSKIAEKFHLSTKDPNDIETIIQNSFWKSNVQLYKAAGSVNQITVLGGGSLTATGTVTGSVVTTANVYTRSRIVEWLITTATTTAVAGFRVANSHFFRGTTSNEGGFFFVCQWGPSTGVATGTNRASVGLHSNQSAPTDVEPSTILNQISMGWDTADTNIQIMSNSGSGIATKKDLGVSFPVPTTDRSKLYRVIFYCPKGSSIIYYAVLDLGTGSVVSGNIDGSVDKIPGSTTFLGLKGWMSVGGTSSVIGIGLHTAYIETNY